MITVPSIGYLVVLPNLDPVIAKDLEEYKINEYCFVSENPWNAMDFQNQSPSSRIIYSPPSASKHLCELNSIPILSFSSFYSPAGHYQATKEWQVWNSHQTFDVRDAIHFFQNSGFLNFKSKISLYEVQHP